MVNHGGLKVSGFEQALLYGSFGMAILTAVMPTLKKITKRTPTKVDDELIRYLEDGLEAANAIKKIAEDKSDCGKENK